MKKRLLLLASLLLIYPVGVFAQYTAVKADLLAPTFSLLDDEGANLNFGLERSVGRHFSLGLQFDWSGWHRSVITNFGSPNAYESYRISSMGISPEARYYPFTGRKPAPLGFFVAGAVRLSRYKETFRPEPNTQGTINGNVFNAGVSTGYTFSIRQRVLFELLAGYGVGTRFGYDKAEHARLDRYQYSEEEARLDNFLRLQFSVGYVFPRVVKHEKAE
jgi:hypothetical protein